MIDFEVFSRQLLSLKQVYFSMHFVGSPSKFLARDPISDCFSSRRRRASSLASTDTASLLVVRVRRGVPVHIVVQRARCTYLLFHYYYFSFAAAKYSNDTSFYKWAEKKWIMEKCQANIFDEKELKILKTLGLGWNPYFWVLAKPKPKAGFRWITRFFAWEFKLDIWSSNIVSMFSRATYSCSILLPYRANEWQMRDQ